MRMGSCSNPATAGSEVDSRIPKMLWLDLAGGCSMLQLCLYAQPYLDGPWTYLTSV